MLDGTILHFFPVDANVILLDSWNPMEEGYHWKILKCNILGIDFIPRHELYVCKIITIFDEVMLQHQRTKKQFIVAFSSNICKDICNPFLPNLMYTCDVGTYGSWKIWFISAI